MLKQIPQVVDPEDCAGSRCNVLAENGSRCHRRFGHSDKTQAIFTSEDGKEQVVEFNHRSLMGGYFFTW